MKDFGLFFLRIVYNFVTVFLEAYVKQKDLLNNISAIGLLKKNPHFLPSFSALIPRLIKQICLLLRFLGPDSVASAKKGPKAKGRVVEGREGDEEEHWVFRIFFD